MKSAREIGLNIDVFGFDRSLGGAQHFKAALLFAMRVVPCAENLVREAACELIVQIGPDPHGSPVGSGRALVRLPDRVPRQVRHGEYYLAI